jgi:hypothetical protein
VRNLSIADHKPTILRRASIHCPRNDVILHAVKDLQLPLGVLVWHYFRVADVLGHRFRITAHTSIAHSLAQIGVVPAISKGEHAKEL